MAEVSLYVGTLIAVVGIVQLLIKAFRESALWGFACLIIIPLSILFLAYHWDEAKAQFFIKISGIAVMVTAVMISQ